jgi:hypothetical protein
MGGRRFFATCVLKSDNDEYLVLHCRSPLSVCDHHTFMQYLCLQRDETSETYREMITDVEVNILLDVRSNVWYN